MTYPYLPYAVTEIYCVIIAVTILFSLNSSLGSEHEVKQLRNMIYSYLLMLVTDILWAFMEDNLLHLPTYLNALINAITISSVTAGCYFWFRFIEDRTHFPLISKKWIDNLIAIPFLVCVLLDLISIFTGWTFFIDAEGHYEIGPIFDVHTVINYIYLIIPTITTIVFAFKTHSKQEKAEFMTYACYMVVPIVAGTLEDTFPAVPLLALNILMMIIILFLKIQNLRISNDALTGLNNRRSLNHQLEESFTRVSEDSPLLVFLIDINSFKSINDRFGHIEGDHALQLFADTLRSVSIKFYGFAARYGGDEFCLLMKKGSHTPERVMAEINKSLDEIQAKSVKAKDYTISVCIGYTVCTKASKPELVIAQADQMLYENKKKWHESAIDSTK